MGSDKNIWSSIQTAMIVIGYNNSKELNEYRSALKEVGLNINECVILAVVESKKVKESLKEQASVIFVCEKEINFFGKLKNEAAVQTMARNYDAQFIFCELPKKLNKRIRKTESTIKVGVNCEGEGNEINLFSESTSPMHLLNFTKETLEKIQ